MWTLRAFIDVASRGIDDEIRRRNRSLLDDAYMRCPPRRVWLYVKTCRLMAAMASMQVSKFNPDLFWNWGPEDDIAQGTSFYTASSTETLEHFQDETMEPSVPPHNWGILSNLAETKGAMA